MWEAKGRSSDGDPRAENGFGLTLHSGGGTLVGWSDYATETIQVELSKEQIQALFETLNANRVQTFVCKICGETVD